MSSKAESSIQLDPLKHTHNLDSGPVQQSADGMSSKAESSIQLDPLKHTHNLDSGPIQQRLEYRCFTSSFRPEVFHVDSWVHLLVCCGKQ